MIYIDENYESFIIICTMNEKFDKYDEVVKMIDEDEEIEEKRKL